MSGELIDGVKLAVYRGAIALVMTGLLWVLMAMGNKPFSFGMMAPCFLVWWLTDIGPHKSELQRWGWWKR